MQMNYSDDDVGRGNFTISRCLPEGTGNTGVKKGIHLTIRQQSVEI